MVASNLHLGINYTFFLPPFSLMCPFFLMVFSCVMLLRLFFFTARSNRSSALKLEPEVKLCNQNYVSSTNILSASLRGNFFSTRYILDPTFAVNI
jgi:hypothetical protein